MPERRRLMQAGTSSPTQIVVVDDDGLRASTVLGALSEAGYSVRWSPTSIEGLLAIEDEQPVLVVLRWRIPLISGSAFLRTLQIGLRDPPPVVVLAEHEGDASMAMRMGARACIAVPIDPAALVQTVHGILSR